MVNCWAYSQLVPALSRSCCFYISNYSDVLVSILCLLILIAKLSPNKKCMAILKDVFLSQDTIDCTHISTQKRWHSPCISADLIPRKNCCLFEVKCIFLLWHMFNIYIYTITKTKVPQKQAEMFDYNLFILFWVECHCSMESCIILFMTSSQYTIYNISKYIE